jgi:hypothetical protein
MVPVGKIPSDKEGALVIRCHQYKGWIRKDSRWLVVVWVWSKTGTIPDNPGTLEIDGSCNWRVNRNESVPNSPDQQPDREQPEPE